jgi:hypothetical protein
LLICESLFSGETAMIRWAVSRIIEVGGLSLAQPVKNGLPHPVLPGPFGKSYLGHEFRQDPFPLHILGPREKRGLVDRELG